jgi:hypothetical protein
MLTRLIELKAHVSSVVDELMWESLSQAQWKQVESVCSLLQPFVHHTNITSGEMSTTIAMVIPVLKELKLHLEEVRYFGCCN